MRKILEELYNGNINPTVKQFHCRTQYDEAFRCMCKNDEKLLSMLWARKKKPLKSTRTALKQSTSSMRKMLS